MSGPLGASQYMYSSGAADFYSFQIEKSLRMEAGSEMYLDRTLGTATNRDKVTISLWVKRHSVLSQSDKSTIFTGGTSGSQYSYTSFNGSDKINFDLQTTMTGISATNEVFTDMNAWIHLVYRFDTTLATQSDRFRIYANGTQLTGLGSLSSISQNEDVAHWTAAEKFYVGQKNGIGHAAHGTNLYYAEFNYADGQSYAPTQFGETKNGVWIPKDPSGTTYGNNGFRLTFADASNFGEDHSGNNNDFAATGLGTDHQTPDSPTFGS